MAVFIINDGGAKVARSRDYSDAQRFGDLVVVSRKSIYPDDLDASDRITGQIFHDLDRAAQEFDPKVDYILPVGDVTQLLQFVTLVISRGNLDPIQTLRYDRETERYYPVVLKQLVPVHV